YVKIVDSALDGLKKTEPLEDIDPNTQPEPLEQPQRRDPIPKPPLNPLDPGTEEAEIRPVQPN
ncbi:MAG: hypothetical protein QF426_06480, partial [Verrucomicrobiales bacterium]|nr:hypothetical protein [Verrucomicrobiales bacterium]